MLKLGRGGGVAITGSPTLRNPGPFNGHLVKVWRTVRLPTSGRSYQAHRSVTLHNALGFVFMLHVGGGWVCGLGWRVSRFGLLWGVFAEKLAGIRVVTN